MYDEPLSVDRVNAGREYLEKLRELGLDPKALFWAWDLKSEEFILMLFTQFFDTAGPLALHDLLVQAYERAATPRTISPFIVELRSPRQLVYRSAADGRGKFKVSPHVRVLTADGRILEGDDAVDYTIEERYMVIGAGTYVMDGKQIDRDQVARRFENFKRRVEALAA